MSKKYDVGTSPIAKIISSFDIDFVDDEHRILNKNYSSSDFKK
jgi:hypothetical protein